jgi:hypothetical protein
MAPILEIIGRKLFPRRQNWEQQRRTKTLVGTLAFSLAFGLVMAKVMEMIYHRGQ